MRLVSNIGLATRVLYVLVGVGLIALALLASLNRPWPVILAVGGAVIILEGTVGF